MRKSRRGMGFVFFVPTATMNLETTDARADGDEAKKRYGHLILRVSNEQREARTRNANERQSGVRG